MTTFKRSAINKLSSFGLAKRRSHFSEVVSPYLVTGTRIFFIQFNSYLLLFSLIISTQLCLVISSSSIAKMARITMMNQGYKHGER